MYGLTGNGEQRVVNILELRTSQHLADTLAHVKMYRAEIRKCQRCVLKKKRNKRDDDSSVSDLSEE